MHSPFVIISLNYCWFKLLNFCSFDFETYEFKQRDLKLSEIDQIGIIYSPFKNGLILTLTYIFELFWRISCLVLDNGKGFDSEMASCESLFDGNWDNSGWSSFKSSIYCLPMFSIFVLKSSNRRFVDGFSLILNKVVAISIFFFT